MVLISGDFMAHVCFFIPYWSYDAGGLGETVVCLGIRFGGGWQTVFSTLG